MSKINFFFINGRPGSGKDTQAGLLEDKLPGSLRISTGDIVRGEGEYSKYSELIKPHLENSKAGGLIPNDVMLGIVSDVIAEKRQSGFETFIFTGFPRTVDQLSAVDSWMKEFASDGTKVNATHLAFSVAPEGARSRAAYRREQAEKKNEEIRPDDDPAVVERRLRTYRQETHPMLNKLRSEGRLVLIDARSTIEGVQARTLEKLPVLQANPREGRNTLQERK